MADKGDSSSDDGLGVSVLLEDVDQPLDDNMLIGMMLPRRNRHSYKFTTIASIWAWGYFNYLS